MHKNISIKTFSASLLLALFFSFFLTVGYVNAGPGEGTDTNPTTENVDTNPSCTGEDCQLKNPLAKGGVNDLTDLIVKILDVVVKIGGYIAIVFIVWSGFLFVKAQGNPEELKTAKNAFFYTIIGVAILLGASALAKILEKTIGEVVNF